MQLMMFYFFHFSFFLMENWFERKIVYNFPNESIFVFGKESENNLELIPLCFFREYFFYYFYFSILWKKSELDFTFLIAIVQLSAILSFTFSWDAHFFMFFIQCNQTNELYVFINHTSIKIKVKKLWFMHDNNFSHFPNHLLLHYSREKFINMMEKKKSVFHALMLKIWVNRSMTLSRANKRNVKWKWKTRFVELNLKCNCLDLLSLFIEPTNTL